MEKLNTACRWNASGSRFCWTGTVGAITVHVFDVDNIGTSLRTGQDGLIDGMPTDLVLDASKAHGGNETRRNRRK